MIFFRIIRAIALTITLLPLAVIAGIVGRKGRQCAPDQLSAELKVLAAGDMGGWDRLESVPIQDPRLEAIRQEAMAVDLPFGEEDRTLLSRLATKAAALSPQK